MVELPEHSHHIAALPKDARGFPVPWFVQWFDGDKPCEAGTGMPDFRVVDPVKFGRAMKAPRCWICGNMMGRYRVFVIGPMCTINRITSEPPSHRSCALFAARACPFLTKPRMRRNETPIAAATVQAAGIHADRNPGAVCLWTASPTGYYPFRTGGRGIQAGFLFKLRGPFRTEWLAEGKPASRATIESAMAAGVEVLRGIAQDDDAGAMSELEDMYQRALTFLPPEEGQRGTDADHLSGLPDRAGEELDTGC